MAGRAQTEQQSIAADLVKAFIPQEASWKEGSAGNSTEECCFKVWDCPVRERYD